MTQNLLRLRVISFTVMIKKEIEKGKEERKGRKRVAPAAVPIGIIMGIP